MYDKRCVRTVVLFLFFMISYDMIYLLTAIGLTSGGSNTAHIYTNTAHRTTQQTQTIHRTTQFTNQEECGPCPAFASYTLAFAVQLRKKHGKNSIRVAGECRWHDENRLHRKWLRFLNVLFIRGFNILQKEVLFSCRLNVQNLLAL